MQLFEQEILQFDATMKFKLQAITLPSQQHRYALLKVLEPLQDGQRNLSACLSFMEKKIPFYRHPKKKKGNTLR